MNPLVITELLKLGGGLIDRIFPDKSKQAAERAKAEAALRQLAIDADERLAKVMGQSDAGQVEINKVEAASDSLFKSGWRPATGWVCVTGLSYQFLGHPLLTWLSSVYTQPPPPALDTADLITLLMGLLGLGAYRTFEKKAGVA